MKTILLKWKKNANDNTTYIQFLRGSFTASADIIQSLYNTATWNCYSFQVEKHDNSYAIA